MKLTNYVKYAIIKLSRHSLVYIDFPIMGLDANILRGRKNVSVFRNKNFFIKHWRKNK